jgi:regulator of cell morphogenesis and NO signaling
MIITSEMRVCDIAVEIPAVIPVLEQLGIGYCCDGQHTLAKACAKQHLEIGQVLQRLTCRQQEDAGSADTLWLQAPLKELSEYIVERHHAHMRDQLKLIDGLMAKVEYRHGGDYPEVVQVSKAFALVRSELTHHFGCEETTVFPLIVALGTERQPELPAADQGSIELSLTHMMADHDQAGTEFQTLRELAKNYTSPSAACPTWRALYRAMEELEVDFYQHIQLENNILFPRALEQARIEKRGSDSDRAA